MKKLRNQETRFAVCITDSEPDLELRKIYQVLPDESVVKNDYIRVVDESGEDYLYPARYFVLIELPKKVERAFRRAS